MIRFNQLGLQRGGRPLFADASLILHAGKHIGVTGANGCGKSSLFKLIMGELHVDEGDLDLPANLRIAHVAQETPGKQQPAIDYVLDGDTELRRIEQAMTDAHGEALAHLHTQMEAIDGYTAKARAARLMHGLGFAQDQLETPVADFSGGWRMRLNLACALISRSDLLLLDEPTNHLDLEAVMWLEQWLKAYPGTLLLISHDREFLDGIAQQVMHFEQQTITLYTGNYTAFERQRAEKLAQQQAAYEKQQQEIEHMQKYVDRFRAKATKARQAQSRIKALERMERISAAHVDTQFHFEFLPPKKTSDPLLKLESAHIGYGETRILNHVELQIRPGMRLGLLGPNGAGKSTLVKALARTLEPMQGDLTEGPGLAIGYFAQHQLEQLRGDDSPIEHLQSLDPQASDQILRDFLGGFGFHGDRVEEAVAPLSGGEKSRLVLSLLVRERPNLLLLDEPTNHLDLDMRHALTMALQGYQGALVLVSHDRHLLRTCCDEFLLIHQGRVEHYNGDLDDYRDYVRLQENATTMSEAKQPHQDKKQQRREAAERRKLLQPLTQRVRKLETEMATVQKAHDQLEAQLADNTLYLDENKPQLQQLLADQRALKSRLEGLESDWYEASEALETAGQD